MLSHPNGNYGNRNMAIVYKLRSAQNNAISTLPPNSSQAVNAAQVPNIRCPHCMHMGAFTVVAPNDLQIQHVVLKNNAPFSSGASTVRIRVCPN